MGGWRERLRGGGHDAEGEKGTREGGEGEGGLR